VPLPHDGTHNDTKFQPPIQCNAQWKSLKKGRKSN